MSKPRGRPTKIRLHEVKVRSNIDEHLPHRIVTLANQLSRHAAQAYQPAGLSFAEWRLLAVVGVTQPISVVAASRHLGVDKAMTSRLTSALIERGLLTSFPDPQDKRRLYIGLTRDGAVLHDQVAKLANDRSQRLLATMNTDERRVFDDVMLRLRQAIGREFGEE